MIEAFETADGALGFLLAVNIGWVAVFVLTVYLSLRRDGEEETDLLRVEVGWLVVVVIVWVLLNAYTVSAMATEEPTPEKNVTVDAMMWGYEISDRTLPAGESVEFRAESRDTVHSFSVYSPDGEVVLTMMLVPGTEQEKVHTFDETGKYEVRCLEYCGTGHAGMRDSLEVVEDE